MHKRSTAITYLIILIISISVLFAGCKDDNPKPTGLFNASFSGDFNKEMEGNARFRLEPAGANGVIIIQLRESDEVLLRLTFPNPSLTEIFLEPGSYTVVPQFGNNIPKEVLLDFINGQLSFKAQSGEVRIGISKPDQISGQIVNAEFSLLQSTCNSTFDSTPQ